MKTNFRNCMAGVCLAAIGLLSACSGNPKDASAQADSANKSTISQTDSANKANIKSADSTNKVHTELKEDASKFLVKAYESGLFEIALSKQAATQALSPKVKELAASLVAAHTNINSRMEQIAIAANFKLPGDVSTDHAKGLDDAAKLSGSNFDKKYMDIIVAGHEKSVSAYTDAYKDLTEGATKTFAGETLPTIQEHLVAAKKVKDSIK